MGRFGRGYCVVGFVGYDANCCIGSVVDSFVEEVVAFDAVCW